MSLIKKPMLAASMEGEDFNLDMEDLFSRDHYWLATPKLDGIRALLVDGKCLSRSFKPIPNHHIRNTLEQICAEGMDGEVVTFDGDQLKGFNDIQSDVMSRDGEPKFQFWVFDFVEQNTDLELPYEERLRRLKVVLDNCGTQGILVPLYPVKIETREQLEAYASKALEDGYEGVMLRKPGGKYKCNRSTLKEALLIKVKPTVDSEAEVLGFVEQMHNANEAKTNELGHTKRSSAKDGMVPAGTLGKFICRDVKDGREFNCGSARGMDAAMRKEIWENQDKYLGRVFTYSYQAYGAKDAPRIPIWKGWRGEADMPAKDE